MVTGAAFATVNRLPLLLLPGDIFARRTVAPVLQQLEWETTQDISVNDCFKPVSRYWDRIQRPEQLMTSLPEVDACPHVAVRYRGRDCLLCRRTCKQTLSIFPKSCSPSRSGASHGRAAMLKVYIKLRH